MDCNRWSLLHVVIPLYLCGLRKIYNIRLFGRRASVLFCTSMPVANVPVYLWKTTVSLLCCIFYKLELWTSMENLHVNWYIVWMLTWISRNFFQHIIYHSNTRMNFAGISPDRWHEFLGWISQEFLQLVICWLSTYMNFTWIVNAWLLLERLYEFTGKSSTRMACSLSFEHLNCWIFIHETLTVCMNSINIITDELDYCTGCCVSASMTGVDFYMYRMWCLSSSMEWDVFILRLMCQHWLCVISYITVISYSPWNDASSVLYFYFCIIYIDNVTH